MKTIQTPRLQSIHVAAALFDFDGTLVDSESTCASVFAEVVNGLGASITLDLAETLCRGRSWCDAFADLADAWPSLADMYEPFADRMQTVVNNAGGYLGEPILPSLSALKRIAERVPVGIVSGSYRANLAMAVDRLGLAEHVATIVGAEDYQQGKPNAEPFLVAAKRLGCSPSHCVVFEDSLVGIQAVNAAGMWCIALQREGAPRTTHLAVTRLDAAEVWDYLSLEPDGVASSEQPIPAAVTNAKEGQHSESCGEMP